MWEGEDSAPLTWAVAPGTLVLNVNDDEGARYMVTVMLRRAGLEVVEACTGADALAEIARRQPALVVLDIDLPDMDGFEVCRRIRENPATARLKVVHTSAAFTAVEDKVLSLEGGSDSYLTQPFEPQELIATVRSLLRLSAAERELLAHAERLRDADQRKDEFLAMLAHELRNPLAAIAASLPLCQRREAEDDRERRAREIIRRQCGHLSRLIDDLLDVARVTRGKIELRLERLDLLALLTRVVATARTTRTDGRRQSLRLELPAQAVLVAADGTRLEQVLMNLLDNASKYTDPGGEITVSLDTVEVGARAYARVIVRDNGIGIAPAALDTVFFLFSQSNVSLARSRGGLGIGLTLVRTLIELHGGHVLARSAGPGRGSEFEVRLPLLEGAAPAKGVELPSPPPVDGKRILIVEDNLDARQALADLCELWGHQVTVAGDGPSGLAAARSGRYDLAFVDIGLPVLDGFEVARRIRAEASSHVGLLVALTGYGAPEQRACALEAGFDLHLVKPVLPEELEAFVRDAGAHQRNVGGKNSATKSS